MSKVNRLKLELDEEVKDWFKMDGINVYRESQNNGTFNIIFEFLYKGNTVATTTLERYIGRGKLSKYSYGFNGEGGEEYFLSVENGNKVSLTLEKPNYFTDTVMSSTFNWYFDFQEFLQTGNAPNFKELEMQRKRQHEEDLFNIELFDRE